MYYFAYPFYFITSILIAHIYFQMTNVLFRLTLPVIGHKVTNTPVILLIHDSSPCMLLSALKSLIMPYYK